MTPHFARILAGLCLAILPTASFTQASTPEPQLTVPSVSEQAPEKISTFRENWILGELRSLRHDMMDYRNKMNAIVLDRELEVADKAMSYASNTVLTFFYVVAVAGGILAIVGWRSVRDLKDNVRLYAEGEISRLTSVYEKRLADLEVDLRSKSQTIAANQDEIERTNEIHSLWLKAGKEPGTENKIAIYDHILELRPEDADALAWKADAALELGELRWALSLCERVLATDPENAHALYQQACARAELGETNAALDDLERAIALQPAWVSHARTEVHLRTLADNERFKNLLSREDV